MWIAILIHSLQHSTQIIQPFRQRMQTRHHCSTIIQPRRCDGGQHQRYQWCPSCFNCHRYQVEPRFVERAGECGQRRQVFQVIGRFIRKYRFEVPEAYRGVGGYGGQFQMFCYLEIRNCQWRRNPLIFQSVLTERSREKSYLFRLVPTPDVGVGQEREHHISPAPLGRMTQA